jgi:hypothetical protein
MNKGIENKDLEKEWEAVSERRSLILKRLVEGKALPPVDLSGLNKTENSIVVGTAVETNSRQRGGLTFTVPSSRDQLNRNLRS